MSDVVITSPGQVTPEWLTSVLSAGDALTAGAVTGVAIEGGQGNWSSNAKLLVNYSADAAGTRPDKLFLKMVAIDLDDDEYFDDSEVTYYTRDYVNVPDAPLLHCYHAAFADTGTAYHLLLDDVSSTHVDATGRAPTPGSAVALADGLAAMHASWWGAGRLTDAGHPLHDAFHIQQFVDIAAPGVPHVLVACAADLPVHWPALIEQIFERHPTALIGRSRNPVGFTLIHGDPGCANILVPRDGDRPIYLIDRQPFNWSLTTWLGVYDLVYATILDWPTEIRRQLEVPMLKRYHDQLQLHGVADYSWHQLWTDYQLMIPMGVYIAVEYSRGGLNSKSMATWLPYLQRTLVACEDHDCQARW